jgi:hypothetical protein
MTLCFIKEQRETSEMVPKAIKIGTTVFDL